MPSASPPVRFAAIGLDHIHALGQVAMLLHAGAEFAAWYGSGDDLSPVFEKGFPQVPRQFLGALLARRYTAQRMEELLPGTVGRYKS